MFTTTSNVVSALYGHHVHVRQKYMITDAIQVFIFESRGPNVKCYTYTQTML